MQQMQVTGPSKGFKTDVSGVQIAPSHGAATGCSHDTWVRQVVQHRPRPKALVLPLQLKRGRPSVAHKTAAHQHVSIDPAHAKGAGACSRAWMLASIHEPASLHSSQAG